MGAPVGLIRELDNAVTQSSDIRRAAILRQLTDLFLVGADHFSDDEISLVDDVFMQLVVTIEESSRALLAARLGPSAKAPPKVLAMLASDDAIEIASPVLMQSECLSVETLIECAKKKSQEHLLAISRRRSIPKSIADILVERGDRQVALSTAMNAGARFSTSGFRTLVQRAKGDDELANFVGSRADIPPLMFEHLLATASGTVREKLQAERKHPNSEIDTVVGTVANQIQAQARINSPHRASVRVLINSLNEAGQLSPAKLDEFVKAGRFEEIVAALSLMANIPVSVIERTLNDTRAESLIVLARAVDLPWETTKNIILLAAKKFRRNPTDIVKSTTAFQRLSPHTAQQILDFHRTRPHIKPVQH